VLKNTTKVTKVARGSEQERPEDVTHEVALNEKDGSDDDDDGTDAEKSMDVVMDTDGN